MDMDWMDDVEGVDRMDRMDELDDMDDIFIIDAIDEMDFAFETDAIPVVDMRDAEEIYVPTIVERGGAEEMDIFMTGEMEDVIITEMDEDEGGMMID
ncbi:hypothetical protein ACSS6W_007187 [Trichoderma asperelloides]|uniref:Uncharacterized protein n=1 Tax=Trichoderma asperellum TaxID=101201 RepID=A0A6V8R5N5_TRIAP|nr:hypothetical protein TASIC1_0009027000 [Trichoderma asperellum]